MKERPVLFNGEMVRAERDGWKRVTRRVVKPQPEMVTDQSVVPWEGDGAALMRMMEKVGRRCPYGQPGDRLWVRETWGIFDAETFGDAYGISYRADDYAGRQGDIYWPEVPKKDHGKYCMTGADGTCAPDEKWRPSIHMPRWASRTDLVVTGVRVERVQDISEEGAVAEGLTPSECRTVFGRAAGRTPRGVEACWLEDHETRERHYRELFLDTDDDGRNRWPVSGVDARIMEALAADVDDAYGDMNGRVAQIAFATLWESIYAKRGFGWEANPWVWVVEFEVAEGG